MSAIRASILQDETFAGYEVSHVWGEDGHNGKHGTELFPEAMKWLWKESILSSSLARTATKKAITTSSTNWKRRKVKPKAWQKKELLGHKAAFSEGCFSILAMVLLASGMPGLESGGSISEL